jgi:hypothetical protein
MLKKKKKEAFWLEHKFKERRQTFGDMRVLF